MSATLTASVSEQRRSPKGAALSDALVFFGATGDLAYKQIFPSLQQMVRRGQSECAGHRSSQSRLDARAASRAGTRQPGEARWRG